MAYFFLIFFGTSSVCLALDVYTALIPVSLELCKIQSTRRDLSSLNPKAIPLASNMEPFYGCNSFVLFGARLEIMNSPYGVFLLNHENMLINGF